MLNLAYLDIQNNGNWISTMVLYANSTCFENIISKIKYFDMITYYTYLPNNRNKRES